MKNNKTSNQQTPINTPRSIDNMDYFKNFKKTETALVSEEIGEELDYINKQINPILSKMMIKIINENPHNVVDYMISYLER
jgi:hypothetical protein